MEIEVPKVGKKGSIGVKSRKPQKAHIRPLLNVHTKFQPPSPIWREDRGGTKSPYPLLTDLGG